jgi:glycosyltransferase involved in cell wall biosynthesis
MSVPKPKLRENGALDIMMVLGRPDTVFTASRAIARTIKGWGLGPVEPVHHGTPAQPAQAGAREGAQAVLAQFGVAPTDPVVLMPGRLQPWKGQHVLIEAFSSVVRACPNAHAALVGGVLFGMSRDYPEFLERKIAEQGLTNHVHLLGHQPIAGWLSRATIVVHASTEPDPFPNTCIEAMAARRPVITNSLSGTCEILTNGVDGLIVPPNAPAALAAAIVRLIRDPDESARLAQRGFERYQATCTPGHMVRPIEAALDALVRTRTS